MLFQPVFEGAADIVLRRLGLLRVVRALDTQAGVVRILAYHRVCDPNNDPLNGDPNVISATPGGLADQISVVARHYDPIGWPDLEASLDGGRPLPRKAVLVTFDDGYRDFLTHAVPVLNAYRVPSILFVPTAFPSTGRGFWWDQIWQQVSQSAEAVVNIAGMGPVDLRRAGARWRLVRQLVRQLRPLRPEVIQDRVSELSAALGATPDSPAPVLTWAELRGLMGQGVTIASHSCSHASLPALAADEIDAEIAQSQRDIRRELGTAPRVFAYPFGHHDDRAAAILKAHGFLSAFSTRPGRNAFPVGDPYSLFRHTVVITHSMSRLQFGLSGFYRSASSR